MIQVINEKPKKNDKYIIVSNYFLGFDNQIRNWFFETLDGTVNCFDIGVWKIKQLKQ